MSPALIARRLEVAVDALLILALVTLAWLFGWDAFERARRSPRSRSWTPSIESWASGAASMHAGLPKGR